MRHTVFSRREPNGLSWSRALLLAGLALALCSCSSVEVIRLQPGLIQTPKGTEPLAAIQVSTMGFFFATVGMPATDLDKAVNELLLKEARKIGADRLINLRFDVTPSHGIWFLTKLLWFRIATAWAVAVVAEDSGEADDTLLNVPTVSPAKPPGSTPASRPSSAPATQPNSSTSDNLSPPNAAVLKANPQRVYCRR